MFVVFRLTFPMFGVRSTVKRVKSSDRPPNVTNQLQSFNLELDLFGDGPDNQKENIPLFTALWPELDSTGCHDDELTKQFPPEPPQISSASCHGNTVRTDLMPKGIRKNVELFNSPYMGSDSFKEPPHELMSSNKKRKISAVFMATSRSGNKVGI